MLKASDSTSTTLVDKPEKAGGQFTDIINLSSGHFM